MPRSNQKRPMTRGVSHRKDQVDDDAAHRKDEERPEVLSDGLDRDGGDGGDDEEVEGPALDAEHHLRVDDVGDAQRLRDQLEDDASDQRHGEQRHVRENLQGSVLADHDGGVGRVFDPAEAFEDEPTDEDRQRHDRDVQGQGLNGRGTAGHLPGGVVLVLAEQPALFVDRELDIVLEDLGLAVAHTPVDERNADDDAADQADRRDANRQVRALVESEFGHYVAHAGGGAVAALEADLDQPSGHRRRPEERHDDQGRAPAG